MSGGWIKKIKSLTKDEKRAPLNLLTQTLVEERKSLACHDQLRLKVQSPWLKEQLERLARENQAQVARLEEKIVTLGGRPDTQTPEISSPGSVAEELIHAWERERNCQEILRQQLGLLKDPEVKELLAKLLQEKKVQVGILRDLIMRYS